MWQDAGNAAAVTRTEKKTAVRLPADVASHAAALCGAAYALCAFMAAYAWNLMWTDCMVLAPLVILGLERLIRDNRPGALLCVAGGLHSEQLLYFNHDLHFLVLWFCSTGWNTGHRGTGHGSALRGIRCSCGSHRRSADPSDGKGALLKRCIRNIVPETMEWYFNIVSELARSLLAVDVYTGDSPLAQSVLRNFCALSAVSVCVEQSGSMEEKTAKTGTRRVFSGFSFSNNMLGFYLAWSSFPDIASGRDSLLYAFLVLCGLLYEALLYIRELKLWQVFAAGGMSVVFPAFLQSFYGRNDDGADLHMGKRAFFACYFVIVLSILIGKENPAADAGDRVPLAVCGGACDQL